MKYFGMFDKKSGEFREQIIHARNVHEAIRALQMHLQEGKGEIALYPADFQLYLIGEFDTKLGIVVPPTEKGPVLIQEVAQMLSESLLGKATSPGNPEVDSKLYPESRKTNSSRELKFKKGGRK